jgi:hypothetical protein
VRNADSFPSTSTTVGLGRSFARNQWAHVNDVVAAEFHVRRDRRDAFLAMAERVRDADNAFNGEGAKLASAPTPLPTRRRRSIGVVVLA